MLFEYKKLEDNKDLFKTKTLDNLQYNFITSAFDYLSKYIDNIDLTKTTHITSNGRWGFADLISSLITKTGSCNLIRTTYSISTTAANTYVRLGDKGLLKSFVLFIDKVSKKRNRIALYNLKNYEVVYTEIHAKLALMYNDDFKIVIKGSQNDTQGDRIEDFTIFTDEETFNFYKNFLNDLYRKTT